MHHDPDPLKPDDLHEDEQTFTIKFTARPSVGRAITQVIQDAVSNAIDISATSLGDLEGTTSPCVLVSVTAFPGLVCPVRHPETALQVANSSMHASACSIRGDVNPLHMGYMGGIHQACISRSITQSMLGYCDEAIKRTAQKIADKHFDDTDAPLMSCRRQWVKQLYREAKRWHDGYTTSPEDVEKAMPIFTDVFREAREWRDRKAGG